MIIVTLLFLVWRILLFVLAAKSPQVLPVFGDQFPYWQERLVPWGLPHFIWSFGNFDGVHYLGIAEKGYFYQFTEAFFPLYPILIKIISYFTSGNLLSSALLISNITFFLGFLIFYKLITKVHGRKIALWSCVFLLSFPTSFFFVSVYTEGVFFLLIVTAFYLIEKKKILAASIVGSFASATRFVGVMLAPALFLSPAKRNVLPLFIVPLGLLIYMVYLQAEYREPLIFLKSQGFFGQERSTTEIVLLPQVFWRYFKILFTTNGPSFFNAAFELFSTIFALLMLTSAYFKKIKTSWIVFSLLAVTIPTFTGTLSSMPRYILTAFPIYVALALTLTGPFKILFAVASTLLLAVTTMLFTQGYWVA